MMRTLNSETSLRIAVQKSGRLTDKTLALLQGIGLRVDDYKRSLLIKCLNLDVDVLAIRDEDSPQYVEDGVCDLCCVGANTVAENESVVTNLRGLEYSFCRRSIADPNNGPIQSPEK